MHSRHYATLLYTTVGHGESNECIGGHFIAVALITMLKLSCVFMVLCNLQFSRSSCPTISFSGLAKEKALCFDKFAGAPLNQQMHWANQLRC